MKTILIVDDSEFMRMVLKDLLVDPLTSTQLGEMKILEADGKEAALKLFSQSKPDIILLDIVMRESEFEGLEFLEEIKHEFELRKVILVSSVKQEYLIKHCQQLGIENYLQKPLEQLQIIEALNKI